MRTVGIIAEYDPFHAGHAFQLEKAKEASGADYVVAAMSPDFLQRGEPALLDKWVRARMALEAGADLVLELPVRCAVGSAEFFAEGGVRLLHALGCIDALSFGCEAADRFGLLEQAARFLAAPESLLTKPLMDTGKNTYVRNQTPSEICHRRQKSAASTAKNGCRKFSSSVIPNSCAMPIVMSMPPEKLPYNSTE